MTDHLNDEELDRLLQSEVSGDRLSADDASGREAQAHLAICESCRNALQEKEMMAGILGQLRSRQTGPPGHGCPSDEVWLSIAAGVPVAERQEHIRHAASCDYCAIRLRQATEDFAADESELEASQLNTLVSATDAWQRSMAKRMGSDAVRASEAHLARRGDAPSMRGRRFLRFWVPAIGFVGVVAVAVLVWFRLGMNPDALVQKAFAERRTIAVRIEGAPWAPLRQQRGGEIDSRDTDRLALVKAKAEILPQVRRHPDDVYWLDQAARLYLIQNDKQSVETAIQLLEKARNLDRDNIAVAIDLASAYLLSADLTSQESNVGSAINLLAPLKDGGKGGETALWNYAVAEERARKWESALSAWQQFVRQYPRSAWSEEARTHLAADQKIVAERHAQSMLHLRTAEQLASDFARKDAEELNAIDRRIEEYQEAALEDWLPDLHVSHASAKDPSLQFALHNLADTLSVVHKDTWLADMLAADGDAPSLKQALRLLALSARTVETADVAGAERDAIAAESLFHAAGLEAGAIRARLVVIFALQYEHQDSKCREAAQQLLAQSAVRRYSWIEAQALLETANCSPTADSAALHAVDAAERISRTDRFPVLNARALSVQSGLLASLGDVNLAWERASAALDLYWRGEVPTLRGYNALIGLFEMNRSNTQFALQADILKDAVQLVSNDPRTMMVAVAYAQLGQALFRAGDLDGARAAYGRAEALVASSPAGRERDSLGAEVELGIARIELEKNLVQQSEERLQSIRGTLIDMADSPLQIEFLQSSGTALLRLNRLADSTHDLDLALALAQRELKRIASENDRWKSSRQYEDLFRTAAEMKLRTDPAAALAVWESLKADSLAPASVKTGRLLPDDSHAVLLTYMALPDGLAVWGWDGSHLRERRIAAKMNSLTSLASRFLEECSDPDSDVAKLRSDAALLYSQIVAPVEPWIESRHAVVIEPDGPLKKIPFTLLIDGRGGYLGDRLDITISPGLPYLSGARPFDGLSAESSALILANPQVPGWPPLPAAAEEAQAVASLFDHPRFIEGAPLQASEIAQLASGSALFHFAGHGFVDVDGAGIVADRFSASTASEFASLAAGKTSLVVLSACSTSSGTNGLYDGESSMVRTLLAAHVRDVVASRWNVDSSSTSLLMKVFYAEMLRNKPVPEALSSAMRNVRTVPEYQHPYYWAAFSVFGSA